MVRVALGVGVGTLDVGVIVGVAENVLVGRACVGVGVRDAFDVTENGDGVAVGGGIGPTGGQLGVERSAPRRTAGRKTQCAPGQPSADARVIAVAARESSMGSSRTRSTSPIAVGRRWLEVRDRTRSSLPSRSPHAA